MSGQASAAQLAGRSFLYGFAGIAGKAAALITVPFLARHLGPAEYGLADLATNTAALLVLIVSFAGDLPTARRAGLAPTADARMRALRMYVTTTSAVALITAVLLVPLSGSIASQLWSSPNQASLALMALALVPVSAAQAALANLPRLAGKGRQHAALALIDLLAQLSLAVLFVALGMGAEGVVAGFLVGSLVGLAAAAWPARHLLMGPVDVMIGLRLVREGTPYLPALVLPVVADVVTRIALARVLTTEEVGLFAVAIRVASVMSLIGGAFTSAYGPDFLGRPYSDATVASFRRVFHIYSTALAGTAALLALWAPEIIRLVAGASFADASLLLPWLAGGGAVAGAYVLLMLAAGVGERTASVSWTAAAGAAVQMLVVTTLVGAIGVVASGLGVLLGQLLALILLRQAVAKRIPGTGQALVALLLGVGVCGLAVAIHLADDLVVVRGTITVALAALAGLGVVRTSWARRHNSGQSNP